VADTVEPDPVARAHYAGRRARVDAVATTVVDLDR
jgi:hypothetical protein